MAHTSKYLDYTVSCFIVKKNKVLLIYNDRYYLWLPPGGHIDPDENIEGSIFREIEEETGIIASLMMPLCVYKNDRLEYFFHVPCSDVETKLGGPEVDRQSEANIYRLEWIPFNKIEDLPLVPTEMKDWVVEKFTE